MKIFHFHPTNQPSLFKCHCMLTSSPPPNTPTETCSLPPPLKHTYRDMLTSSSPPNTPTKTCSLPPPPPKHTYRDMLTSSSPQTHLPRHAHFLLPPAKHTYRDMLTSSSPPPPQTHLPRLHCRITSCSVASPEEITLKLNASKDAISLLSPGDSGPLPAKQDCQGEGNHK